MKLFKKKKGNRKVKVFVSKEFIEMNKMLNKVMKKEKEAEPEDMNLFEELMQDNWDV